MEQTKLSSIGKRLFDVIEFDKDEKLITEIRKHPFGLSLIYGTGVFISLTMFALLLGLTVVMQNDEIGVGASSNGLRLALVIGGVIFALFVLGVTYIAGYLYKSNVILVTNEKLAQVLYKSLFNRKISQLSIGDVQDVTVVQNGVFARAFNYGTLVVETAGEQENYTFTFAINPYESAKLIVGAHETNLKEYGN